MKKFGLITLTYLVGVILFSQGLSFARSEVFSNDYLINFHAFLLAGAGIGLMLLARAVSNILDKITVLEEKIKELSKS